MNLWLGFSASPFNCNMTKKYANINIPDFIGWFPDSQLLWNTSGFERKMQKFCGQQRDWV